MESVTYIVAVYVALSLAGFFLVPLIFSRERLLGLVEAMNYKETNGRDRFLSKATAAIAKTGIHPTAITVLGFLLTAGLALALYLQADIWVIFVLTLFAGLSDTFDGTVARMTGKITNLGGALDGLRDFSLFLILTGWFWWGSFISYKILLWFFIGALFVENFKLLEIFERRKNFTNLKESFKNRFAGYGKLSIDRVKYFLYIAASLALIFENAVGLRSHYISVTIFHLAIAAIFASILFHSAVIRFESK